jgi:hypothetical protein
MIKVAALAVLGGIVGIVTPGQAGVTDGMYFAGGDFDLKPAQRLLAANCNMPPTLTVVLLKTLMVRRHGKMYSYALPER